MKWILVLLIAVGVYFAWQNWPTLSEQARQIVARFPAGQNTPGAIGMIKPDGSTEQISVPVSIESWGQRDAGGLRMNLPFELEPINVPPPSKLPKNAQFDCYAGKSLTHEIIITHGSLTMAGAFPLWPFIKVEGPVAGSHGLQVLSKGQPTLLNGLRAQRSDYVSKTLPRVRYRVLLLERANHVWFVETHAFENDEAFEPSFQKIIYSVQPL